MKIYRDMLNFLKIETIYILSNKKTFFCIPLEITENTWLVSCDADNLEGSIKLKVKFNGSFLYLNSIIEKKIQGSLYSFTYTLEIDDNEKIKDRLKFSLFKMLSEMEKEARTWNKRKEERYEIGLNEKLLKAISFKSPEQIVVADRLQLPCVVNNLSYSGAKITTTEGNFHKDKKICLYLSFVNPIEQIPIISVIKNAFIKTTNEKKIISVLSVKFESSPYEYKKRLDNFIKNTRREKC